MLPNNDTSAVPQGTVYKHYLAWRSKRNRELVAAIQNARPKVAMMPLSEALQRGAGSTRTRRVKLTRVEDGVTYTVTKWVPYGQNKTKQS